MKFDQQRSHRFALVQKDADEALRFCQYQRTFKLPQRALSVVGEAGFAVQLSAQDKNCDLASGARFVARRVQEAIKQAKRLLLPALGSQHACQRQILDLPPARVGRGRIVWSEPAGRRPGSRDIKATLCKMHRCPERSRLPDHKIHLSAQAIVVRPFQDRQRFRPVAARQLHARQCPVQHVS